MNNIQSLMEMSSHEQVRIIPESLQSGGGRLLYISVIRFVSMVMIIACHICQYYNNEWAWWLNVGVQMFLIISGFLYGSKSIKEPISWLKRNFSKILLPYYVFLFTTIFLYTFFCPESNSIKSVVESIFCVGTILGIENIWFVGYILFCYLLTPYLVMLTEKWSDKKESTVLMRIALFFGVFYIVSDLIDFYFQPDKILCYFIGYFFAFLIRNYGDKYYKRIFYISLPMAIISKIFFVHLRGNGFPLVGYIGLYSHILLGVSLVFGLMLFFKGLDVVLNKIKCLLDFSDKYSYCIYLAHQLFILSPLTFMQLTNNKFMNICIALVTAVVAGVCLQYTSSKITSRLNN